MSLAPPDDSPTEAPDRSRFRVVADVLRAARSTDAKARILWDADLDPVRGERYLSLLDDAGLLDVDAGYAVTEAGRRYLADWDPIEPVVERVEDEVGDV